ncbi:MAG: hypothetical protein JWM04_782 [Verrucomicrobiales bacterium]|nr:hypothetical protein [Verrucomicrobiales bacterium]
MGCSVICWGWRQASRALFLASLVVNLAGCQKRQFTSRSHQSLAIEQGGTLTMEVERCSVNIMPGLRKECRVDMEKFIRASDGAEAQKGFEEDKIMISTNHNGVEIGMAGKQVSTPFHSHTQPTYRLNITLPIECAVNLVVAGGGVQISELHGTAKIHALGGGIQLGRMNGRLNAEVDGGGISVKWCGAESELVSTGGGIKVEEAKMGLSAKTSGGSVTVTKAGGSIKIETTGGKIKVEEMNEPGELNTSGGSIHVGNSKAEFTAKTIGGSIEVDRATQGIRAQSSGGSIKATFITTPKGSSSFQTTGGSVNLYFGEAASGHVSADSTGGTITASFPVTEISKTKTSLVADLNGGGPEIVVKAFGGSVFLRKQP